MRILPCPGIELRTTAFLEQPNRADHLGLPGLLGCFKQATLD